MVPSKGSSVQPIGEVSSTDLAGMNYDEMIAQYEGVLDHVVGSDLTAKDQLIGEPLVITKCIFRPSSYGVQEYVSVEAKSRAHGDIVFNDGGTGIRRQLLQYFASKGVARLRDDNADPDTASAYDWNAPATEKLDTSLNMTYACACLLHAPRGLTRSEYEANDERPAGVTFYLG